MENLVKKYLAIVVSVSAIALTGCTAKPANHLAMSVKKDQINEQKAKDSKFYRKMTVDSVTGGRKTNALLISNLDDENFKMALNSSLSEGGYITVPEEAQYKIRAEILELRSPIVGLNFTTTSLIRYEITDASTHQQILDKKIEVSKGAKWNDSFLGSTRYRMAIEASIRHNICTLMQTLESENS